MQRANTASPSGEANARTPAVVDLSSAQTIQLSGDTAVSQGSGVQIDGSVITITGGGHTVTPGQEESAKGVKAGTGLTLTSGIYVMDCSDDAFHTNGTMAVSGGAYTVSTGDDAFHADEDLTVSGSTAMEILTCYEGLEGSNITIAGGEIHVVSSDDGVNVAGGMDNSGFGGRGMGNQFTMSGTSHLLTITGGRLLIEAMGDGQDSNGAVSMTGGTVQVFSTGNGDSALDYDSSFALEGGTLLSCDSGSMTMTPSSSGQCMVYLNFAEKLKAGTYVRIAGDGQSFVFCMAEDASSLLFTSPELTRGGTYTVSYGGTWSGDGTEGICSDGVYSGGTELTTLTLTDTLTTYGSSVRWAANSAAGDAAAPRDRGWSPWTRAPFPTGHQRTGIRLEPMVYRKSPAG